MGRKFIDITGQTFGRWTVIGKSGEKYRYWWCRCECGKVKQLHSGSLKNGHSLSCGCYQKEIISEIGKKNRRPSEEIVEAYNAGKSLREIGIEFRLSKQRVHTILKTAGVQMRPRGKKKGATNEKSKESVVH